MNCDTSGIQEMVDDEYIVQGGGRRSRPTLVVDQLLELTAPDRSRKEVALVFLFVFALLF